MTKEEEVILDNLRQLVEAASKKSSFKHHYWFMQYHLDIAVSIASELCDLYPDANRYKTLILLWVHDYEKIIEFDNQYNTELIATKEVLKEAGLEQQIIDEICKWLNIYNLKENLISSAIEIQIASSADAASHLTGPFASLYWYENPRKTIDEIMHENIRKLTVDWEQKITLLEVKKSFYERYMHCLELSGKIPTTFIQ